MAAATRPSLHAASRARKAPVSALLLIDLINTWGIADGARLMRRTHAGLAPIARLRAHAGRAGVPVVYVNDNFGQWRSDFKQVVAAARAAHGVAADIVAALAPGSDDYFVLKPRHSGFYATPLHLLLGTLGVRRLVLSGVAGDQCVLATAGDALVRGYEVVVPRDAIVCATTARTRAVLAHFRTAMDIATPPVRTLRWR
jgi:nicotinamidase-related amidase